ncbi:MAG: TonB-dependent receptor [Bacteroidales bacterium]|nr:TonB-dependent receptor [Bacteroidales bacterium]
MKSSYPKIRLFKLITLISGLIMYSSLISAAQKSRIIGVVAELSSSLTLPYALVELISTSDSTGITYTQCDSNGNFELFTDKSGEYRLRISSLGFITRTIEIETEDNNELNTGTLYLSENHFTLDDAVITFERVRAMSQKGKITYYISELISDASANGFETLKHIPGIQTDIKKSIRFEGSDEIIVLVNGRERERSYISTISAKDIDRIEIMNTPPLKYRSTTTAVIDIILKRPESRTIKGEFNAELPVSRSQTFIYPSGSLNIGGDKLNIHTSYSGEVLRFNILESNNRVIHKDPSVINSKESSIVIMQLLKQKTWSHSFHLSADYLINKNTTLNFYGNYNPFSQELDGTTTLLSSEADRYGSSIIKDDTDLNHSTVGAINIRHKFGKARDKEIEFDAGIRELDAHNSSVLKSEESDEELFYDSRPGYTKLSIRAGYSGVIFNGINIFTGVEFNSELLTDREIKGFMFNSERYSAYGRVRFTLFNSEIYTGVRVEKANWESSMGDHESGSYLLPDLLINHTLTSSQSLKFNLVRSVKFPGYFQLNPAAIIDDPLSMSTGNPNLEPEIRESISLEHSIRKGSSFIAYTLFYNKATRVISNYTQINNKSQFATRYENLGESQQYGLRASGSFGIWKKILVNPFVAVYNRRTIPLKGTNNINLTPRSRIICNTGLSALASLNKGVTVAIQLHYSSAINDFQGDSYSDLLGFLTVEKGFKNGFKAGIIFAQPLKKSFIFDGFRISSPEFSQDRRSSIELSLIPATFRLSYSFKKGDSAFNQKKSERERVERKRKGF